MKLSVVTNESRIDIKEFEDCILKNEDEEMDLNQMVKAILKYQKLVITRKNMGDKIFIYKNELSFFCFLSFKEDNFKYHCVLQWQLIRTITFKKLNLIFQVHYSHMNNYT